VRRITVVELQQLVSKGEAFVVDVRNDASYKQGHIKGARLIPTNQILQRADELPQDKVIVTYCS
jgi:rhodanese-related sulfurtransferase